LRTFYFIVILLFLACGAVLAQEKSPGWFSPARFSLDLTSTYYFNPWDNYNRAVETVTKQIMLDKWYYEPRGEYQKINGDVLYRAGIRYEVLPKLGVVLTGQYGTTSARFEMYPDGLAQDENWYGSDAVRQEFTFDVYSFGIAADYRYPLTNRISARAGAGIQRYTGKLNFRIAFDHYATGPITEDAQWQYQADLKDNTLGWNLSLGVDVEVWGPVSLQLTGEYRQVSFSDLRGPGESVGQVKYEFPVELVGALNYFGIAPEDRESRYYEWNDVQNNFVFRTEPGPEAWKPATINMNALGIRLGLSIGL
jgi:opacity protein-like surface antigen